MVSDRGMKPLKGDQQLRSVSLSYSVALQALKPKSSPRRIRAWMQAPIEVSRREGEVFLLDILSHRMSAMACYHPSSQLAFYELQGKNQYEDNRAVCVDQYRQRTDVCKCLHLIGRRKVMGQRYSGVHRSREGILQDGKSGEFFPDIFSFESNAGTRRAGLVLEIIVSHPHVPGRGSRPVRLDGCNDLRVLLPAERDHVQSGTTQRCNTSQGNLGIVERDELGALFAPACGSDSILCVVAQDLFDRRIVLQRANPLPSACHEDFQ